MIHKTLVRTSQETHYVSATKPNRLMLFRETVAVYCETIRNTQIHSESRMQIFSVLKQMVLLGLEGLNVNRCPFSGSVTSFIICPLKLILLKYEMDKICSLHEKHEYLKLLYRSLISKSAVL
jgi:hypothetical protein